jgi:dihydrofolate reductase
MRKLIVTQAVTLDGYAEGPGGDMSALPMDRFFDEHNRDRQREADTLLCGATTYRIFRSFWPPLAADPAATDVHREISHGQNTLRKIVVSDSLTEADTAPWTDTTTIVPRADVRRFVAELKSQPGKDILVFGSLTLWRGLLAAGLVDELYMMIGGNVLGHGTSLFGSGPVPPLRLLDNRRTGSDNVVLHYEVARVG